MMAQEVAFRALADLKKSSDLSAGASRAWRLYSR